MNETITHQQNVAREILHKLECAGAYSILAGGAPRDWYFDKPANDLDFYVYLPEATVSFETLRWELLGLELQRIDWNDSRSEEYKCMEHLSRIWEGEQEGVKFQIMVMRKPTFKSVVPMFGASVCMAWWKGEEVRVEPEFEFSHIFKTIFKKANYTAKEKHIQKMKERYPEYKVDSFTNLEKYITGYARKFNVFPNEANVIQHYKENN